MGRYESEVFMKTYYYCSVCDNTVEFGHDCPSYITPMDMSKKIKELQHDIEMADIVYSMNYADDARLTLLESKVNAIIEYLLNSE